MVHVWALEDLSDGAEDQLRPDGLARSPGTCLGGGAAEPGYEGLSGRRKSSRRPKEDNMKLSRPILAGWVATDTDRFQLSCQASDIGHASALFPPVGTGQTDNQTG